MSSVPQIITDPNAMQQPHLALSLIEQLKGGLAVRLPWQDVQKQVDALIQGLPWHTYEMDGSFRAWRGRVDNNIDRYDNVAEFGCPPVSALKGFGRCNRPGVPVLYAANSLSTVFAETAPEPGDTVHVGLLRPKSGAKIMTAAIGEIDHVRRFQRALIGDDTARKNIEQLIQSGDEGLRAMLVDAYFAELFGQPALHPGHYKATAALATELFKARAGGPPLLDGFFYPSVAHRGGMNVVFSQEAFANKLEWERFEVHKIQHRFGFGIHGFDNIHSSKSYDFAGKIAWQ